MLHHTEPLAGTELWNTFLVFVEELLVIAPRTLNMVLGLLQGMDAVPFMVDIARLMVQKSVVGVILPTVTRTLTLLRV